MATTTDSPRVRHLTASHPMARMILAAAQRARPMSDDDQLYVDECRAAGVDPWGRRLTVDDRRDAARRVHNARHTAASPIRSTPRPRGAGRPRGQAVRRPTGDASGDDGPPGPCSTTSLSVEAVRAQIVHDELRRCPELVERVEDIYRLRRLAGWAMEIVGQAIDTMVAERWISESADGRLYVHPRERAS